MSGGIFQAAEASLYGAHVAIGLWMILASIQWISAARVFGDEGLLPWSQMPGSSWSSHIRRRMSTQRFRLYLLAQLSFAVALVFASSPLAMIACLIGLILTHAGLLLMVGDQCASGADKMGMIVLVGTLITAVGVFATDTKLVLAGCLITGGQLMLCYMVSGLSKLCQSAWRSGAELAGVMAHEIWGHRLAAALTKNRAMAFAISWLIIGVESLFPLALLLPGRGLEVALAFMLVFHVMTALIMRLNLFPWAFVAAYPAVLLLSDFVRAV